VGFEIKVLRYEIKGWVLGFEIKYLRFEIRVLSLNFEKNVDCTIVMFLHQLLTTIPK
jgi:hypothetical protein